MTYYVYDEWIAAMATHACGHDKLMDDDWSGVVSQGIAALGFRCAECDMTFRCWLSIAARAVQSGFVSFRVAQGYARKINTRTHSLSQQMQTWQPWDDYRKSSSALDGVLCL